MLLELLFISGGLYVGLTSLLKRQNEAPHSSNAKTTASSSHPPKPDRKIAARLTTAQAGGAQAGGAQAGGAQAGGAQAGGAQASASSEPQALLIRPRSHQAPRADAHEFISLAEAAANREIQLALAAGALLIAGNLIFAPLWFAGAGLIFAQLGAIAWQSSRILLTERRVSFGLVDLALISTIVVGGFLGAAAAGLLALGFSKKLAARTEAAAQQKLAQLFNTQTALARVLINGAELQMPVEKILPGDIVVVDAGQRIPIDGLVQAGSGAVDQHMLTGESYLVERRLGDPVFASTVLVTGRILVQADKPGTETVAAQLAHMMQHTTEFKEQIVSTSDMIGRKAALPTLVAGGAAYFIVGISGSAAIFYTAAGHHLRFTGPISMLNFLQLASEASILVKDGRSLQQLSSVDTIVFDKTGTLTLNRMHVENIHAFDVFSQADVLSMAASAELHQNHPIAEAILEAARQWGIRPLEANHTHVEVGFGIRLLLDEQVILVGSERFMRQAHIPMVPEADAQLRHCEAQGLTLVLVALNGTLAGSIEVGSTLRPEAAEIVQILKQQGFNLYIVSGDQENATRNLAERLGIEHHFSCATPMDKARVVETLQEEGHSVCFIGDGINDAIVLKKAHVSISLRGATTVATDAAQVVLLDGTLSRLPLLLSLSHDFKQTMEVNVTASVVPAVVSGLSVFLFHTGLLTAMTIYYAGFGVAMVNSISPGLRRYTYR